MKYSLWFLIPAAITFIVGCFLLNSGIHTAIKLENSGDFRWDTHGSTILLPVFLLLLPVSALYFYKRETWWRKLLVVSSSLLGWVLLAMLLSDGGF